MRQARYHSIWPNKRKKNNIALIASSIVSEAAGIQSGHRGLKIEYCRNESGEVL